MENEFIEVILGDQRTKLYIIPDVEEDTPLLTQTRKEISDICWVLIQDLPTKQTPDATLIGSNGIASKFFMVLPFVGEDERHI